jgi:hypothetical protein
VRLAGYRVSVVAAARVASAADGVAGPNGSFRSQLRRRRLRAARAAQLHRRLVYAPGWAVPLHWITLVPLAILRCIVQLLGKEPGAIPGEFSAAFGTAFGWMRIRNSRKRLASTKKLGWASIAGLRVPTAEVRRRRAMQRELSLTGLRSGRPEIRFLSGGGAWTVAGAGVLGIAVLAPLLGARTLTGGGLLPLEGTLPELWGSVAYGWRDAGLGFVGAADPFAAVLAVLGSLTFWDPSYSLVLLYFLAFPLAALGAWMAASRLTDRSGLRATAAVLWILAPTFLAALVTGRPAAILLHLLLPWLFFAGFAAARSWSASAASALLFAAIVACAPSLTPALLVGWVICLVVSGRSIMRFIGIPLPALALAAPLIWDQGRRGNWLALLADPGRPVPMKAVPDPQLLLGIPVGELGGWAPIIRDLGIPVDTMQIVLALLLAPLAVIALAGLFLPGIRSAGFSLLAAILGVATAVASNHLFLTSMGDQKVSVWTGSGLSLYWLGIVGAVIVALRRARGLALVPAAAASLALLVAVVPLAASGLLGTSPVAKGIDRTLPAFIAAEAQTDPRVGTLQLVPQRDGGILGTVVRGAGPTLNDQSTIHNTRSASSQNEAEFSTLAGNLVSQSGLDAAVGLADFGIRFALLRPAAGTSADLGVSEPATPEAAETARRAATALDGNAAFAFVGDTAFGQLWRTTATADAGGGAIPDETGQTVRLVSLILAAVVIGATVLLSIPTGASREAVRQANRDANRQAARANVRGKRRVRVRPTGRRAAARAESRPRSGRLPGARDEGHAGSVLGNAASSEAGDDRAVLESQENDNAR